mmetsp:Transcript_62095/g.73553  ORF Transcript_62095/g.73553 Transcript_62095/m.73553 type:complete len:133 (-) Transcript_62095:290-688(-)|eukprot:CAMPEP_0172486422 /NCGR_PEP_ID=MMETSP1066-20121228/15009_1 /TAXON_ID=671091 /ORGANISM="Coscinodiscus wailesii, Strain CCMP2513" /LENGTH=132 /DNA_ID=CAMNT_0013252381 /DNA_START=97 /DNA_END=495 /DNA_ORIENTATION=-
MTNETELKEYSLEEIKKHSSESDCWLIIGNTMNGGPKVYDVTKYLDDHPGGSEVLLDVGGENADELFEDIGHSKDAREELANLLVGKIDAEGLQKLSESAMKIADKSDGGMNMMIILVILVAVAVGYWKTQM